MKNLMVTILLLGLAFSLLSGCNNKPLEEPEYPLSTAVLSKELKEWGGGSGAYIIDEDFLVRKNNSQQSNYSVADPKNPNFFVIGISNGTKDGERLLSLIFPRAYSDDAIHKDEMKSTLALASRLFGGFKNENQVYNAFIKEYGVVNTEREEFEISPRNAEYQREGASCWKGTVNGITCEIALEQFRLDDPEESLGSILFTTDKATFFKNLD